MRTLGTKLLTSGLLATTIVAASSAAALADDKRIAFFVSDLSNVFHQSQAAEAQRYAAEKYGAEVVIFDGQADSAVMTQNIDQVLAGGFDAATLHIWDAEAATPGVNDAVEEGLVMTSFFGLSEKLRLHFIKYRFLLFSHGFSKDVGLTFGKTC